MFGHDIPLEVTETHMSPLSPPPYMVGAAEVEVDTETGEVKLLEFDACVDCGTPINRTSPGCRPRAAFCRASA